MDGTTFEAFYRRHARPLAWERDGVRLAGVDFGGEGPPALLLHGLAGHAREWAETAGWLRERCRVVALDARGHGASERLPADVSPAAHVADAAFAIERLGLEPVAAIGQSLGGRTALDLAADRPDLVRALVVAEASPAPGDDDAEADVAALAASLRSWPVPFPSREEAVAFFGGPSLRAEAWADGLERRDGGLWPRFDVDVMARTLRQSAALDRWPAWERIACRALVVRAREGHLSAEDAQAMAERGRDVEVVEVEGAGHDVHLDRPAEWRAAVRRFLDRL
jgi:pimeloyl-ACP methyl ester carboxylesterase